MVSLVIDVVGVGADGSMPPGGPGLGLVLKGRVLVGSPRLLDLAPEVPGQLRRAWPSPMLAGLPGLFDEVGTEGVVVLASGDPLVAGMGSTLIRLLGADLVRVHPAVSSVALARARMRWPAEECEVVSLVSTPAAAILRQVAPGVHILVLGAGPHTPGDLARVLVDAGMSAAELTVLGNLGADDETVRTATAAEFAGSVGHPRLAVIAVAIPDDCPLRHGTSPGLPDDAFDHDGQLTKAEIRVHALAGLRPLPGHLLWDVGAGAGSVSIEWARHHPRCRAIAVERDPARARRIRTNARALGVPGVKVVEGPAAEALPGLPAPDAVFLGGGVSEGIVAFVWESLRAGGRVVAHAVTLESEEVLHAAYRRLGGVLRRISVERAEPLGSFTAWSAARPVVHWAATKATTHDEDEDT